VSRQETLSDYLYILMDVLVESRPRMREPFRPSKGRVRLPRWGATHCNDDIMASAAIVVAWREGAPTDEGADTEATRLRRDMQAVCDACMLRAGVTRRAREMYWWSEDACEGGAVEPDAGTPEPAAGSGKTKKRWPACTRPTAKRGGL
jgi:hypothetical protein